MSEKMNKRIEFLINVVYATVIAMIIYILFKYVLSWIMPFLLALCIVSVVHPLIKYINNKFKFEKKIVAVSVMTLVYTLLALLLTGIIWQLISLVKKLFVVMPDYYQQTIYPNLIKNFQSTSSYLKDLPIDFQKAFQDWQGTIINSLENIVKFISQKGLALLGSITNNVPSFFIAFAFMIMLSFFISLQYDNVISFIKSKTPDKLGHVISDTKVILKDTLLKYLRAYFILMCVTFVELSIGFLILKVNNAILIALGIAFFDMLPFFGTGAIVIPWIIIELIQGNMTFAIPLTVLYVIVVFVRNILEPKVVGDQLGLNPIVSLMSIYLGFKLFGVLGMIGMPMFIRILLALEKKKTIRIWFF